MKKRILIFSTAYLPLVGGAEVAVKEITDRLSDFEFVMITSRLDSKLPLIEKIGNIEVHRLGKGDSWDKYRLIWQGAHYARNLGHFDTVWSIMASYAGFAALKFKKRNKNIPFLLTLQEGDSKWDIYKHVWWCWSYFKQIFKRADKIQAISNYLADWAREMGAKCPIDVVPNGVDVERFKQPFIQNFAVIQSEAKDLPFTVIPSHSEGSLSSLSSRIGIRDLIVQLKKELGINETDKIIITISRLVKKNGVADLIKAIKFLNISAKGGSGRMTGQYPISNIQLLILGDGEMKDELIELTHKLKIQDKVHFLGNINHNDLPKYLWVSDVFCRPSLSEGLGNVFLEALAAGVPVVATKVGGIPDFLIDGETGLFCKVNNPQDIAKKIKEILDNKELRNKLIDNGKKLVVEKYNWDLIAKRIENIFVDLCKKES